MFLDQEIFNEQNSYFCRLKNFIIYRLQKDIYKKIKVDLNVIEINNNYNLLLQRACAKTFIEQYKDAIKDFSEITINDSNILLFRAYTYYLDKQYNKAKEDIVKILQIDKDNIFAKNLTKIINHKIKSCNIEYKVLNELTPFINLIIENSVSYFNKLIEIDNKNYKYYLYLAIILFVKQDEKIFFVFNIVFSDNNKLFDKMLLENKYILDSLTKALNLHKESSQIYTLIGLIKYFIVKIESRIEYRKKLDINSNKNEIEIFDNNDNKNNKKEKIEEIYKYFDKALNLDSSSSEVYYYRALINLNNGFNEKQALDDIEKSVMLAKENKHKYYLDIIEIKENVLDPDLIFEFSKKIIRLAPNSNDAFFANLKILEISFPPYPYGVFTTNKELINSYEYILKKCPKYDLSMLHPTDYFQYYYCVANAYYELQEYDKCIKFVKKVKDKKCWLILSNAFLLKKDYKKAILNYKKFLSMPIPADEFDYFKYYENSEKEIDIAKAYFKIGYCYEKLENINKAIKSYKKSIKNFEWLQVNEWLQDNISAYNESAYFNLAVIYTKQKKYNQAIEYYNDNENILKKIWELEQQEYERKKEDLKKIKQLENESKEEYLKKLENALNFLERKYKLKTQKYNKIVNCLYFNRGNVFLEIANYNRSLNDFEKALDYDATDLQAISNIIDIYRKQKNVEKIKEYTSLLNTIGDN